MAEVVVPDLGDFADVPVSELLAAAGDEVTAAQPLVVLESDKSSMEIPAGADGTLTEMRVAVGDTVSAGDVIAVVVDADPSDPLTVAESPDGDSAEPGDSAPSAAPSDETRRDTEPDAAAKPGRRRRRGLARHAVRSS